ncbi:mucin-binding protein [Streptococcus mitis]|uniref:Cell wall surface anchor family protein n=1 Tax=Streptococcus mitis TaxID=28037 RepID=A0A0F2DNW0_STRMT|nr:MucBP domain-containing protein [Streptococcus mitis]KJQ71645.1 cell wall surface anchor family protein [Streptococcus mitis]
MYSRMEKYHGRRAQRFSIRKYSFGAASVLLGTALVLGANGVQAEESSAVSTKTPEVTKSEKKKPDAALTTPVVEELPELKIDAVKADEKAEANEDVKTEATPVAEKEVSDKSDKEASKEKSDKEQADKKEATKEKTDKETSEKVETEKAQDDVKTVLTQLTSEADVMATVASNFSDKEVKDVEAKQKLSAAVAAVKLEAVASKGLLSSDASKDQMVAQVNRLSAAIEAVYAEMKRAGHVGKVEAVLADTASKITGKDVLKDGETVNAVTNAYVEMNADNTRPTGWGIDTTISTSTLKAGSITKIELTNLAELGAGLAVNTEIRATDGTVVGKVKSIDFKTTTGNNNNKSVPYWAQRTQRGMTYDQRVAEQPAVANETGTYTYNIEWNDKVKDYPNVSFGASNLSGNGYLAPEISKDTPYTATIKIDGRTVLEHTYTRKGQQANYQKQGTSVSLSENNGLTYLNNEQIGRSDSIVLKTDSDVRYGVGSKFTIKLPNADFTEFKELEGSSNFVNGLNTASTINPNKGDSITYRPASRWANVKANENNVWILNDGRDTGFTLTPRLISPTELELTVTEGTIQEGSTVSMPLQSLGIEKVIKDKTLTSEYSNITYENGLIKEGYVGNDKTAATLTVSGGESVNGEKEDVTTTVPNGWSVVGDGKVQGEPPTGAVVRTFKDLVTGEVIGFEPTRYTGNIPLSEDGSKDYTNVLGNKYDVSNDPVDLVKEVNGEEYILADLPPENAKGTLSVTKTRARDLYSEEELKAKGINGSAFVTPAEYDYVKKTKVEEVNRTIKFVYADNVEGLAGTEVFPSEKQTVSYTGSIKLTAEGKAVINSNDRPVYINWKGTDGQSTDLPELAVPQKEGYIASVEKVPVQATTATDEDYEYVVKYTAIQKAKTTFVDEKGNAIPGVAEITEQGGSETPLTKEADVKAKIKELENKGYELVSNTYPEGGKFDTDKDTDQEFKVTLKAKEVTVTPDQPKTPGTPVDPNNPDGPKYPAGLEEKDLNKTVTRTITYVYADGTPVLNEDGTPKTVTQEAKFTREAKVNLVTGEVTYGDWSEAKDLAEVKSPVVKGYLADKATVPATKVTADSENTKEVVTYKPIGSWIPNIPGQPTNPIKYPNNPDDPTQPGKPTEVLPYVPGFTPKDKDGNPLKPVDPTDPTKGYEVPNLPTDPSQDTPINYVKDTQKAKTTFVDEKGNPIPGVDAITEQGDSDTPLTKEAEVKAKIKELENKGYELVSNTYPEGGKFDKDKDTDQEFKVTLKAKEVTVTPDQPKTPGTPVDPNNPDGPKYPAGLEEKDLNKTVTRTITYVYADGTPVLNEDGTPKTVTQEAKFTREAKVNLVTGEVTYGDWSEAKDLPEVKSPVVKGYLADKATVPATKVTADSENTKEVVTYKPIGSWIPNIPGQPTNPIKYPNDPTDPTKPGQPTETLPYVPGFTPEDKDGNPLKPVDPNDPTKGYEVPSIPTNPGEDTPINYVANKANLVVKYVDENGKELLPTETKEGKVGDDYSTSGKVITGYVLDRVEGEAKGKIGTDGTTVTYVYKPLGSWIPNIPGQPTNPIKYPNDPTDPTKPGQPTETLPYVPGYTPKDGNEQPLKPVDPQDPTKGYVVPNIPTDPSQDTVIKYEANKAKLVVKYVDENGKDLIPSETTEGKVGDEYTTTGKVIPGHLLVRVDGDAKGKIGTEGSTVTYVYKPIGSWIPNIPGQPTNPIKYPNDPQDPTKPGQPTEVLPYVPGYTPKDGNEQPLKPVDPTDPSKGYVVPNIPTDPSQDTVINYVANKAKLVVKYVDENGKDLIPAETTEGKVGDEYTTTGKVIPGYLLVRVDGDAKGKIGTEGSTVTYVYKPIGSWIPNIPGQPTNPIKYPNDPQDPTKPGSDKPVLPYVPGHTPVDGNGQPLKPVDPNDPTKGYITPDVPTNPGEDTPINYIPNVTPNGDRNGYTPQPKPQPEQVVTYYVDENGKDIAPSEKGAQAPKGISGYEYVTTTKDPNGNLVHHYKKVATPQPVPSTPETPEQPVAPVQPEQPTNPNQPAVPAPAETSVATDSATQPATPKYVDGQKELPNTGTEANASLAALGLLGALGGFGLLARKKKED